jgi:hypothetical protein
MAKTVVASEVSRTLRRRISLEIEGRAVHHAAQGAETAPDEGSVRRRKRADRHVEALLYEVDHREASAKVD